jgi:hypothetical protein
MAAKEQDFASHRTYLVIDRARMERAIARARELAGTGRADKVVVLSAETREFLVESGASGQTYHVRFEVDAHEESGEREIRAVCCDATTKEDCKGYHFGHVCHHIAVAAGVNAGLRIMQARAGV